MEIICDGFRVKASGFVEAKRQISEFADSCCDSNTAKVPGITAKYQDVAPVEAPVTVPTDSEGAE